MIGGIKMALITTAYTCIAGRLKKLKLQKKDVLLPIFEAVVNSIQSIEERHEQDKNFSIKDGKIKVILSEDNTDLVGALNSEESPINKIEIIDNGIGFNQENFDSFMTADSMYKERKGCKGIGHFQWLKLFQQIEVRSTFNENDFVKEKDFIFSKDGAEVKVDNILASDNVISTKVTLSNFVKDPSLISSFQNKIKNLAENLFFHIIWYYLDDNLEVPEISVIYKNKVIELNSYKENLNRNDLEEYTLKYNQANKFKCIFFKQRNAQNLKAKVTAYYIANDRVVTTSDLTQSLNLSSTVNFKDDSGEFVYFVFITSDYLDDIVSSDRTSLIFPKESTQEDIFTGSNPNQNAIEDLIISKIREIQPNTFNKDKSEKHGRLLDFVENHPEYKFIISKKFNNSPYIEDELYAFDNKIDDNKLDLLLHSIKSKIEEDYIKQGNVLKNENLEEGTLEEYKAKLQDYLSLSKDLNQSELAKYVIHRKIILELLEKAISVSEDGNYQKESVIHNIIMPMKKTSNDISFEENNLWIINEDLTFSNYVSSDISFKNIPVTSSESKDRPDILAMDLYEKPILFSDNKTAPFSSFTIIEFKRPMRTDVGSSDATDPFTQIYKYIDELKNNKLKTSKGRPVNFNDCPIFVYIIADLTDSFISKCEDRDLLKSSDNQGYFGYHKSKNAYISVISYDGLLLRANKRNYAFFDKLKISN